MSSGSKALAVIPARGGSRGILGKNLVTLGGRPLIAFTISAALDASEIDRVIVTTDSPEIAAVARRCGAEVPFLRPQALARDATPVADAVRHAVESVGAARTVVLLQPTSPLRGARRIDEALRLLRRKNADTVVSVCEPAAHPWQCVKFNGGRMRFAVPRPARRLNRQEFPRVYALNGAIYAARAEHFLSGKIYGPKVLPLVMEAWESVDIDDSDDLALAEFYLKRRAK